jgi:hypothetical protein
MGQGYRFRPLLRSLALLGLFSSASANSIFIVNVSGDATGRCEAGVGDRTYPLGPELDAWLSTLKSSRTQVRLKGGVDTPWRCVGSVMTAFARAKTVSRVGFISQPDPAGTAKK